MTEQKELPIPEYSGMGSSYSGKSIADFAPRTARRFEIVICRGVK